MMTKRREKFVELAEKRVTRAIKDLRLIGNLANRSNYEYTDYEVTQIISALEKEIKRLKSTFTRGEIETSIEFKISVKE
jgi:hypothetical protein